MPPKVSSAIRTAIRRNRENQQFNLALELLIHHDAKDKSSLFRDVGYVSDFIRIDALTNGYGVEQKQSETKNTENNEAIKTIDESEIDGASPTEPKNSANRKVENQQNENIFSTNIFESVENIWNSSSLQSCPIIRENFNNSSNQKKLNEVDEQQTDSTTTTTTLDFITNENNNNNTEKLNGGAVFQWFRNRSARFDRMEQRWKKQDGLSEQVIVQKVMLEK